MKRLSIFHLSHLLMVILSVSLVIGLTCQHVLAAPMLAVVTVTNANDSGSGSLRQAIADATAGDTIIFADGLSGSTITLSSALVIGTNISIDASNLTTPITLSGNSLVRVMLVNAGVTTSITGLNIVNGYTTVGGAGIYNNGTLTITDCTISDNAAGTLGGGIANNGTMVLVDSTVSGNAAQDGGGIFNNTGRSLTINGSEISGNSSIRGGGVYSEGTITLTKSEVSMNAASENGGGVYSTYLCTVEASTISDNSGVFGGGILNQSTGTLTVTGSTFEGNLASSVGGGIGNLFAATIVNSSFTDNYSNYGGAVYNAGAAFNTVLTISNSTFSGNSAADLGGGIYNRNILHLKNSIVANSLNSQVDCYNENSTTLATNINNLIETNATGSHTCGIPFLTGDPGLDSLKDNGGDTKTMALLVGSAALNAGDNATCEGTDQRGVIRPQNSICDIGAVEMDTTPPSVTVEQGLTQTDPTNQSPIVFDVHFSEVVTGFENDDVTIGGIAGTPGVTISGSGADYTIEVTGMADGETIVASIPAGAVKDAGNNNNLASTSADNSVLYDTSDISIIANGIVGNPGGFTISANGVYYRQINSLQITFNTDANNPAGDSEEDDVTNPNNYMLVQAGINQTYDTESCAGGLQGDDANILTGSVAYDNTDGFVSTVTLNGGMSLPWGEYRLFVCGTTSITDQAGNLLNGGSDSILTFTLAQLITGLPNTGFPVGSITILPEQPSEKQYSATNMTLVIPSLGVDVSIVGVPGAVDGWDATWLGDDVGWLSGTAFPTWAGNTVITGHVWDAINHPGPFAELKSLKYGDTFQIYAWGQVYTYEVRENKLISAANVSAVLKPETLDWVTLLTCEQFNEDKGEYQYRRMVRAVLIEVK